MANTEVKKNQDQIDENLGATRNPNRADRTFDPTAERGSYNPQQYSYQQMRDSTRPGEQISTQADGLRGVSDNTRNRTQQYQDYQQGDRVTQAQQQLQSLLNNRPGDYNSKYGQALDNILQQIQNPEKFQYSFNGDEMFKQYADLYTQQGRQASMDAMGQAAGLTGGYGNSYAQQVGNQMYDQYLMQLYDRGNEMRNQAFNEWQTGRADQYNQLNALMQADQNEYNRYRDQMADWQTDRGYYTDAEQQAYARDYGEFTANRDYWNQQQQLENADWWNAEQFNEQQRQNDAARELQYQQANAENQYRYDTLQEQQAQFGANYDENIRQFNANMEESIRQFDTTTDTDWAKLEEEKRQYDASLTEQQRQYNQNVAIDYVKAIIEKGQMPSAELLVAAGLSQEDAQKLKDQFVQTVYVGGGSSGSSGSSSKKTTSTGSGESLFKKAVDYTNDWLGTTATSLTDKLAGLATQLSQNQQKKSGTAYVK